MPNGVIAIRKDGYLDTNYIWYQALVPLLYLYLLMSQPPMYRIIRSMAVLASSLPIETIKKTHYMTADPGYDDQKLYDLSTDLGFHLVCPVHRYKNTPQERLKLVDFHESALGQVVYSKRGTSIEPLIEHIKSVFRIDLLPVRGYDKVCAIVLLSVLLYQILVYYNCKMQKDNPKQSSI